MRMQDGWSTCPSFGRAPLEQIVPNLLWGVKTERILAPLVAAATSMASKALPIPVMASTSAPGKLQPPKSDLRTFTLAIRARTAWFAAKFVQKINRPRKCGRNVFFCECTTFCPSQRAMRDFSCFTPNIRFDNKIMY